MKPILIVKAGSTLPEIVEVRGDFEDWIIAGLSLVDATYDVRSVWLGDSLPDPDAVSGIVVTGSAAMVSDREAWSERTAEWLGEAAQGSTPLLGICYGHQLVAHALGGEVGPNPCGREIGTIGVELDAQGDALLGTLPSKLVVHASHMESVLSLPEGAVLLGANDHDPHHAYRLGDRVWGTQFHPEFDADVVARYIAIRRGLISEEGQDPDALIEACVDSPHGDTLLRRFGELVVEHASD
jgi:GMP synthase (glutamine-hydrolysing)